MEDLDQRNIQMTPTQISAQYAAYVWFTEQAENANATPAQAQEYARGHWKSYIEDAHEGLGRLLLDIVHTPAKPAVRKRNASRTNKTAVA